MIQRLWAQSILAFLCCVIIFSFMLGARPLNSPDETRYSSVSLAMVQHHDYITPKVNGIKFLDKPVLYYWTQAASIHLFGVHNWSLRLVSMLFACLGCLAIFLFACQLYDKPTAWLTLLMLITAPLYFISAHYVNMDMAIAVFITLCLSCFYQAVITASPYHRKLFLYGCYIFAGLGFLTKGLIGFVLPGLVILIWIIWQREWSVFKWIFSPVGFILFLLIVLPWLLAVQHVNPDFFHYFFIYEQFDRFSQSGFNNVMPWWFYLASIAGTFFPWSMLIIPSLIYFFKHRASIDFKHEKFLIVWILTILLFFSIPQSKIITYILPVFPPLALLFTRFTLLMSNAKKYRVVFSTVNMLSFLLITVGFIIALNWYDIFKTFIVAKIYLYDAIGLFAMGSCLSYAFYRSRNWLGQIILTGLTMALMLWLVLIAGAWPKLSIAPIGEKLQAIAKPTDKIASFGMYPYALSFYIKNPIVVVTNWNEKTIEDKDNWKGHFWYGSTPAQKKNLLLTKNEFWQLWASPQPVFVVMRLGEYKQLEKTQNNLQHVVEKTSNEVLVENH